MTSYINNKKLKRLALILGNQLFPIDEQTIGSETTIFMCEDQGLCTYEKHHKSKIALFFMAMRSYRDELIASGYTVKYLNCNEDFATNYIAKLEQFIKKNNFNEIIFYEIEDKTFEAEILGLVKRLNLKYTELKSLMFMDDRQSFKEFCYGKEFLLQANYYKKNRKRFEYLIENDKPLGGKWSFDEMNRLKVPKDYLIPQLPKIPEHQEKNEIYKFIENNFQSHPGKLNVYTPYTTSQALDWLDIFFKERFNDFGPYEDAIVENQHFLLHSVLSSSLNIGLLTPNLVLKKANEFAEKNNIPINSLEGFIRQILGWREFIRGVYQNYSNKMESTNFWGHKRKMLETWYEGTTGIPPLDDAIKGASEYGYTHHINRLMILSNVMNMSGIDPDEIYKWFMEMFIDSSEWVMVPNVYGMGTFADGGTFATKPYICGSSYMLRMSNFKKGDWCDIVDGLYWNFIERNREFFISNPRLSLMVRSLDKMKPDRKNLIYTAANQFIEKNTYV